MSSETYSSITAYSLSIIPLFVLMGNMAGAAGYSPAALRGGVRLGRQVEGWIGVVYGPGLRRIRPPSLGPSVATAVTIGKVALPEMKRFGYADGLATGSVAAGGTLGILIPPSTGFVLYAILTEESIGKLFIAGHLARHSAFAPIRGCHLDGHVDTTRIRSGRPKHDWQARKMMASLRSLPLIGVILASIGGIYLGVFTPVEAAGVGATLVSLLALGTGAVKFREVPEILLETVTTTAMLYLIIIGAHVFGPFLALTHIPETLALQLEAFGLGPYGTLALILVGYIILGMFFDGLAMLVVTMPVVFPIIAGLGFDPIWFGVICVVVIEMGLITPPVGINVFVVKGVAAGVPMSTIFRGVLPFWIAMAACLALLVAFPQIALFLPGQMR